MRFRILEELFLQFSKLIELIPIAIIGLMVGCVSYFADKDDDNDKEPPHKPKKERNAKEAFKHTSYAIVVCLIIYACLDATDLPYLAKIGVSSAVSFFGIDNIMSIIERLLALRSAKK